MPTKKLVQTALRTPTLLRPGTCCAGVVLCQGVDERFDSAQASGSSATGCSITVKFRS